MKEKDLEKLIKTTQKYLNHKHDMLEDDFDYKNYKYSKNYKKFFGLDYTIHRIEDKEAFGAFEKMVAFIQFKSVYKKQMQCRDWKELKTKEGLMKDFFKKDIYKKVAPKYFSSPFLLSPAFNSNFNTDECFEKIKDLSKQEKEKNIFVGLMLDFFECEKNLPHIMNLKKQEALKQSSSFKDLKDLAEQDKSLRQTTFFSKAAFQYIADNKLSPGLMDHFSGFFALSEIQEKYLLNSLTKMAPRNSIKTL